MREYIKKKKIDSLDLKYLVPKKLTIHKTKTKKKEFVKLPPISPGFLTVKKDFKSPKTPKSLRGSRLSSTEKTEEIQETRALSRERKKGSCSKKPLSPRMDESNEVKERITKINEKEGHTISHLC
jgi:phage-related tail protein